MSFLTSPALVGFGLKLVEDVIGPLAIAAVKALVIWGEASIRGDKKGVERKKLVIDKFKEQATKEGAPIDDWTNLILSPLIDLCVGRNKNLLLSLAKEEQNKPEVK